MKFYMSYWSRGYRQSNNMISSHTLDMHKLSVFLIKKHYGECHMITDSVCKDYFTNIGFDSISTELDCISHIKTHNWALGKLFAYKILSEQNIEFAHIDYDVFLWKPFPEHLLKSEVFVQCVEPDSFDTYKLDIFNKCFANKHHIGNISKKDTAYNMGIFGGINIQFINEYANSAIQLTLDNKECFDEMATYSGYNVACLCEQYYLKVMSDKFGAKVKCLIEGMDPYKVEHEANLLGYTHLNSIKDDQIIKDELQLRMKEFGLK